MTCDNKYVFVSSDYKLTQSRIDGHKFLKQYAFDDQISLVITTPDNKYAFVGLVVSSLVQICIDSQTIIKNYRKIHADIIRSMAVTTDSNFLITFGDNMPVKKISIKSQEVVKEFPLKCGYYQTIMLAPGDDSLFVYDVNFGLKLIDLADGVIIKDFGRCHNGKPHYSRGMLVTRDGESLFTTSYEGDLEQWSVWAKILVHDFGNLGQEILSICD
jgi:hypothetical protein